jgi:hypothetical protein
MDVDPAILRVESLRLRRAIATKREQCRQAYADNRLSDFHRLTGEVESLGLLMLRVAEQMEVAR